MSRSTHDLDDEQTPSSTSWSSSPRLRVDNSYLEAPIQIPRFHLVVALTPRGGIGRGGDLPWAPMRLKADLAFFKHLTVGAPSQLAVGQRFRGSRPTSAEFWADQATLANAADPTPTHSIASTVLDPVVTSSGPVLNVVIMGRKTWESIPESRRPLPSRLNVILTRQRNYRVPEGVLLATSIDEALKRIKMYFEPAPLVRRRRQRHSRQTSRSSGKSPHSHQRRHSAHSQSQRSSSPDTEDFRDATSSSNEDLDDPHSCYAPLGTIMGDLFIIGGASLYRAALMSPACDKLFVTRVKHSEQSWPPCDVYFPARLQQTDMGDAGNVESRNEASTSAMTPNGFRLLGNMTREAVQWLNSSTAHPSKSWHLHQDENNEWEIVENGVRYVFLVYEKVRHSSAHHPSHETERRRAL